MSTVFAATRPRRHPAGLAIVAALHGGLLLVLHSALDLRIPVLSEPPPIQARVLPSQQPAPTTPVEPIRGPKEKRFVIEAPPLPDTFQYEAEPDDTTAPWPEPVLEPTVAAAGPSLRTLAAVDPRWPLTQARYPSASVRLGEEGNVLLELTIAIDGRVRAARVVQSSGHPRLDEAAIAEALRAWRLRPATLDGAPVESRHRIRVQFRLDQR
ncbi:MAG: TonB family protein [Steroidobacteraceae bacterium]